MAKTLVETNRLIGRDVIGGFDGYRPFTLAYSQGAAVERHAQNAIVCFAVAFTASLAAAQESAVIVEEPAGAEIGPSFLDVTDAVGLGPDVIGTAIARACLVDLDADGFPDAVIDRHRVFLNRPDDSDGSPIGRRFVEVAGPGLPTPGNGDVVAFADLDNDGRVDAIVVPYIDLRNPNWTDHGRRAAWHPGRGDGTFGEARPIEGITPATTSALAVGDADRNGRLDLWLGHWYVQYGASLDAFQNELALQQDDGTWTIVALPAEALPAGGASDPGGRPTYGAMIANLVQAEPGATDFPELLELNYGRRWNRLWVAEAADDSGSLRWNDVAGHARFDGDAIRHGVYPEWAIERFKAREIELTNEEPFRSNGNTFDGAIGDVDRDGDFDVFLAEITHGWAGESSDRSRLLLNSGGAAPTFATSPNFNVDRIPPSTDNWNQGDLFAELADFDHDGRLDLLLSSGDYPDDQRLRLFLQNEDGVWRDATQAVGLDHDGSQQISLGDVNGDGALDVLVGQTFTRYTPEMKEGREPRLRLFVGRLDGSHAAFTLRLEGDPSKGVARDALGAVVRATLPDGAVIQRQLVAIGGHAGKQHDFLIHLGLGGARRIESLEVVWPNAEGTIQRFEDVEPGRYRLRMGAELEKGR